MGCMSRWPLISLRLLCNHHIRRDSMGKIETIIKVAVHTCISWSWLLILCLGAGIILGNVLAAALPPVYQSTAVVQLNAHAHASQTQIIQPVASYSTLVTSDPVL